MSLSSYVAGQLRKPSGILGKMFGLLMNRSNNDLNEFMMSTLDINSEDHILEIGFGNGGLIYKMAEISSNGKVAGIDFSHSMVEQAINRNQKKIDQQLVDIRNASVAEIPFDDSAFDKVCSANTIYFWPDPEGNISEVSRVLKKNGRLVLGFRSKEQLKNHSFSNHDFKLYTNKEIVEFLNESGFKDIEVVTRPSKGMDSYCVLATKI